MSQSSEINGLFEKFIVKLTYHKTSRCQSALHCQGSLNLIQNVTKIKPLVNCTRKEKDFIIILMVNTMADNWSEPTLRPLLLERQGGVPQLRQASTLSLWPPNTLPQFVATKDRKVTDNKRSCKTRYEIMI